MDNVRNVLALFGGDRDNDRTVGIVRDYDEAATPCRAALQLDFSNRFSVIQHTARRNSLEMVFDKELYLKILEACIEAFDTTDLWIHYSPALTLHAIDALHVLYSSGSTDDDEPPESVRLSKGKDPVAFIATEFWTQVGGPWPYHDSYTYSIYTADDHSDDLLVRLCQIIRLLQYRITLYLEGDLCLSRKPDPAG